MSLIPTWPTAVGALAVGLAAGAYADHTVMAGRVAKIEATQAKAAEARSLEYARLSGAARIREQEQAAAAGRVEQEKENEIARVRAAGAAELNSERMRRRAERPAAPAGGVPQATPACPGATGAELYRPDALFLVGVAQRADEQRAALAACYGAYDALK